MYNQPAPQIPLVARILPSFASVIAILLGSLALIGWQFDLEVLKRVLPGFVAINPATAALFGGIGIALLLRVQGKSLGLRIAYRARHRVATPELQLS